MYLDALSSRPSFLTEETSLPWTLRMKCLPFEEDATPTHNAVALPCYLKRKTLSESNRTPVWFHYS